MNCLSKLARSRLVNMEYTSTLHSTRLRTLKQHVLDHHNYIHHCSGYQYLSAQPGFSLFGCNLIYDGYRTMVHVSRLRGEFIITLPFVIFALHRVSRYPEPTQLHSSRRLRHQSLLSLLAWAQMGYGFCTAFFRFFYHDYGLGKGLGWAYGIGDLRIASGLAMGGLLHACKMVVF
jgi:hypothetical protein